MESKSRYHHYSDRPFGPSERRQSYTWLMLQLSPGKGSMSFFCQHIYWECDLECTVKDSWESCVGAKSWCHFYKSYHNTFPNITLARTFWAFSGPHGMLLTGRRSGTWTALFSDFISLINHRKAALSSQTGYPLSSVLHLTKTGVKSDVKHPESELYVFPLLNSFAFQRHHASYLALAFL